MWEKIRLSKDGEEYRALPLDWPYHGPKFPAPSFIHYLRRQVASECDPEWSYIKDLTLVHPAWFPFIMRCPGCKSPNVKLSGWTATGHREVHGLRREECVLRVQLRCGDCEKKRAEGGSDGADDQYCFSTMNPDFWQRMSLWEIPREYLKITSTYLLTDKDSRRRSAFFPPQRGHV